MFPKRHFSDAQIHRNRYPIALTVTLAAMMETLDISIVNVAISQIMGNLGATIEEVAWVSTGYIVANVIILPLSGWLSALFGRRNYFMGSIVLFIVASFFCGTAGSLESLVFWRILQGLAGGGLLATAQSTIYEAFKAREIGTGMAIFGMGVMLGPTLGPTLGGYITYHADWPWIFFINLPIGLIALFLANHYLPDSKHQRLRGAIDWSGIALLALGIGALQIMLERGERLHWFESWEVQAYALVAVLGLGAFIWHELRIKNPVVDLRICQDRQFAASLFYSFLLGMALYATIFYLPIYLQTGLGYNAWETGLVILPGALTNALTMIVAGRLAERSNIDLRILVVLGVASFSYAMWQHGQFSTQSGGDDFFWPMIFRGIGLGLMFIALNGLAMATVAPERIPNATGLYSLVRQLGGSVGIALAATQYVQLQARFKADLSLHVNAQNLPTQDFLWRTQEWLQQQGVNAAEIYETSLRLLDARLAAQADMLAFAHIFTLFSLGLLAALPLLLIMRKAKAVQAREDVH